MATLITSGSGFGLTNPVTGAIDTTGATLLVVVVACGAAPFPTLSDNKGNTWTALTTHQNADIGSRIYYVNSNTPTVGSGHTFTATGTSIAGVITVMAFNDTQSTPFDVENGANSASASTLATGSVTPTNDGSIIIAGLGAGNNYGGAGSIDASFSITYQKALTGGVNYGSCAAYLIQGAKAAVNPTFTFGSTVTNDGASIAVFKTSAATGPANLKSYNTNLKANIKSIDGNVIANIKSLDTNV